MSQYIKTLPTRHTFRVLKQFPSLCLVLHQIQELLEEEHRKYEETLCFGTGGSSMMHKDFSPNEQTAGKVSTTTKPRFHTIK